MDMENVWIVELFIVISFLVFANLTIFVSAWWLIGMIIPFGLMLVFIDVID